MSDAQPYSGANTVAVRAHHVALFDFLKNSRDAHWHGADVELLVLAMIEVHALWRKVLLTVSTWPIFQ